MRKIYMVYKNEEPGDNNDWNQTNRKLNASGTKIIADSRPKNKKDNLITKKNRVSRKEYKEKLDMGEKWRNHYVWTKFH